MNDFQNPYAAPTTHIARPYAGAAFEDEFALARPGTRWWARLIDNFLLLGACIPAFVVWVALEGDGILIGLPLAVLPMLVLTVYQWVLIARQGQTLGKKWSGIKIIKTNGAPVTFLDGVILREWVVGAIGALPWIGGLFGLLDVMFIFNNDRRCLHDRIASTRVIIAPFGG